jgi:hypothetical protein
MNKGDNPTIMRFNRNSFVSSNNVQEASAPDLTTKPDTAPQSAPFARFAPPVSPAIASPQPVAPKFDASARLAELRAEAMKSVNRTVMSQVSPKQQADSRPTALQTPVRKSRPVVSVASTKPAVKPVPIVSSTPSGGFSDNLFANNDMSMTVGVTKGLSLASAPAPRRRQAIAKNDSSRVFAKQAQRLSTLKGQKLASATPTSIQPVSQKASVAHANSSQHSLVSTPLSKKSSLAKIAEKANDDAPVKDYKSVVKHDRAKKRAGKMTKKQKLVGLFASAAIVVGLGAYVFYLAVPDLAIRIAASQAGIDVSYPTTIMPGFVMSDVSSNQEGEVVITYTDRVQSYTITQRRSSWDSDALLNNFIIPTWGGTYSVVREKGLTIFIADGRAAWVSGGVQFIIDATDVGLSNDQLRSIALSI